MFLDENYHPGTRSWVLHQGYVTISCVLTIDQFNQPANYLKANSISSFNHCRVTLPYHKSTFFYIQLQSAGGRHCVPIMNDCLSDWQDTAEGRHCDVYTLYVETSAVEVMTHHSSLLFLCNQSNKQDDVKSRFPRILTVPIALYILFRSSWTSNSEGFKVTTRRRVALTRYSMACTIVVTQLRVMPHFHNNLLEFARHVSSRSRAPAILR